ncbi:zinc-binding dehydrogenase [Oceanobacillus sp. 143]|uniref:Alcohol dehydrogenase n=1 Tax=Oceanobacillus zhaokaii TaxID=2052660 RepID=A0A345PJX2_9BACI|nr:NAD(P)-dependent alcohol dehydrogenase [Oceanobacillus zhaokaii]AXI10302.1 alcohol dehydrogenase [Oceanobacillus zhaokaii]QGS69355.1 zinc-binding dehydrogenase [Oceanobacillus sp. 143]
MKAIISSEYGGPDTLQFNEIEKPKPLDHQVLVKIHAASINYGNMLLLQGNPLIARLVFGVRKPKYPIPGGDMAGTVEAVGENITQFQPGDEVFGDLSGSGWGAFAEYAAVPEEAIVRKPHNLSFEEAAAVPMAAVTALQAIRNKGKLEPGQKVLVHGGSGGVGLFAVQIAKALGAEVTAVVSTRNVDLVQSIGADHIIDYTKADFAERDQNYDLILGVNGSRSISTYKRKLNNGGIYVNVGGGDSQLLQTILLGPLLFLGRSKKMSLFLQRANQKDLEFLRELIEEGKVKAIIDKTFKLSEAPEAYRYFEEEHLQGKVVLLV